MNKKWEYSNYDEAKVKEIANKFNISELLSTILVNRNIVDDEEIKVFLNPTRNDFYNPYSLPDMEIAVKRIIKAIENKEKVIIYGDYDVDGITSISVLKKFLDERGLDVGYFIPNRLHEGYGLNKDKIREIVEQKYTLMITVDCGITGNLEVDLANELGLDVIITDHHEPSKILPNAIAVVDTKREDNEYDESRKAWNRDINKLI